MRASLTFLVFIAMALAFTACGGPAAPESPDAPPVPEPPAPVIAPTSETNVTGVEFQCRVLRSTDDPSPAAIVMVKVNGQLRPLDTISVCDRIDREAYAQYQIPAEAVAAVGGWWAGGGDYFYALPQGNQVAIFHGWQDEGQEDEGFHYQEVAKLDHD